MLVRRERKKEGRRKKEGSAWKEKRRREKWRDCLVMEEELEEGRERRREGREKRKKGGINGGKE